MVEIKFSQHRFLFYSKSVTEFQGFLWNIIIAHPNIIRSGNHGFLVWIPPSATAPEMIFHMEILQGKFPDSTIDEGRSWIQ